MQILVQVVCTRGRPDDLALFAALGCLVLLRF